MRRRSIPPDEWQYGERLPSDVRGTLLQLVLEFVLAARTLRGVKRIALLGSLVTDKGRPKDADVLVAVAEDVDLDALARAGRRLKGRAQGINSGADVFLATTEGQYVGRVCHYRDCHPRAACQARHCGARLHLNDDLDILALPPDLIASPPLLLHPQVFAISAVPDDVASWLVVALQRYVTGHSDPSASDLRPI